MVTTAVVGQHVLECDFAGISVPDPVVTALTNAKVVACAGDRISENLGTRPEVKREPFEHDVSDVRTQRGLICQTAPYRVACVMGRDCRKELLAHGRTKTIRPNQQLSLELPPVREGRPHAFGVLLDAEERMIEVIMAVGHHLSDQLVKPVPRRYRLWKGKVSDDRPIIVEGDTLRDVDSDSVGPGTVWRSGGS
jgi:hypothetical protein